jgi:hypothetical protein
VRGYRILAVGPEHERRRIADEEPGLTSYYESTSLDGPAAR